MIPRKIGTKEVRVFPEAQALNKWIARSQGSSPCLPLKSALEITTGQVRVQVAPEKHLGYIANLINDVQHNNGVFLLSSVYGGGNGQYVMSDVLDRILVLLAVRKLNDHTWINDRDQFRQPTIALPDEFITDCAVWCLFHGSNQTSSLKDVEYKGVTYQVRNQFFPFKVAHIQEWDIQDPSVFAQLRGAKDTFVATWLAGRNLSPEAKAVLDAGRKVYEVFYKEYINLNRRKFKLDYWDVGWYQVRNSLLDRDLGLAELNALKEAHNALRDKLRPKVYEYGFLDQEVIYG